jgi:Zn-dependent M28 family amino/carboxypeptidase
VAVLLELARVLDVGAVHGDVWLVFFDAEDNGYLDGWDWIAGSRYFAANLAVSPEYVIIVDMVGDAEQELFYEGNSDPHLQSQLWAIAAELGYTAHFVAEQRHTMLDDHIPFVEQGIPSVDIIDFDYPYWHTTEDTLDKLSPDSLERVGRVLEEFLERGGEYPGGH